MRSSVAFIDSRSVVDRAVNRDCLSRLEMTPTPAQEMTMTSSRQQHILFLSFPMYGHVFPSLTIAEELGRRGHRVTYATGDDFAGHVRRAGVDLYRYPEELASIPARINGVPDTNEVTITCLTFVEQSLHTLAPRDF